MSLDDLKARQSSAAAWKVFSQEREGEFQAALESIQADTKARAGIDLECTRGPFWFRPREDGYQTHGQALRFKVPGISAEIILNCIVCNVSRVPDGSWKMHCQDWTSEGVNEFEVSSGKPWVPLRITNSEYSPTWSHCLWWRGPEDNEKVASAILDGFAKKERPSEFGPLRAEAVKNPQAGCVLIAVMGFSILALVLGLAV